MPEVLHLIKSSVIQQCNWSCSSPLLDIPHRPHPFFLFARLPPITFAPGRVSAAWRPRQWKSRLSLTEFGTRSGYFSSDRSIREYATRIWQAMPSPSRISCAHHGMLQQ